MLIGEVKKVKHVVITKALEKNRVVTCNPEVRVEVVDTEVRATMEEATVGAVVDTMEEEIAAEVEAAEGAGPPPLPPWSCRSRRCSRVVSR